MDLAAPSNRAGRDAHFGASWNICHRVSPISEGPVAVLASPSDWLRATTPSASVTWIRFSGSRLHRPPLNRLASGPPWMCGNVGCYDRKRVVEGKSGSVCLFLGGDRNIQ